MKKDEKQLVALLTNPATRERAFAELVKQYSQPLYWQIRRLVLSHDNADDVLQNTFVKAWMNIDSFQGKSQLSTWMYRIAINESIDFLRRQRNVSTLDIDDAPNVANQLMSDDYFDVAAGDCQVAGSAAYCFQPALLRRHEVFGNIQDPQYKCWCSQSQLSYCG